MPVCYTMNMQIRIRDKRNKGWFFLDNEYLNGYAKIFGAIGTAIYVSLCRHVDAEQKCFPSQELISKELAIAPRTVRKYLKMFADYNLIEVKRDKSDKGTWLNNTYYLIDKSEWKAVHRQQVPMDDQRQMTTEPEANDDTIQRQPLPTKNTNRKNTNKKNTNIANSSEFADKVNYFIKLFEPINPNYTELYKNTTQRNTLLWLIEKHGPEKIEQILKALPKIIYQKYAPSITTPLQLKNKLAQLVVFVRQRGPAKSMVAPAFNEISQIN